MRSFVLCSTPLLLAFLFLAPAAASGTRAAGKKEVSLVSTEEEDTISPARNQLAWIIEVLNRHPIFFREGEKAEHFGRLGADEGILDEFANHFEGDVRLGEVREESDRSIRASLVMDNGDVFAAEIDIGLWIYPHLVNVGFEQEEGGDYGIQWCLTGFC